MEYTREILNRRTGDLETFSMGDWITVTELGVKYAVGEKKVRSILHHIGLLAPEGRGQKTRYRLTSHAVNQGLGKRIEASAKRKWPFDVISPLGQQLVAQVWEEAAEELEAEKASPLLQHAEKALAQFKAGRKGPMTTQEEVCWLADHFGDLRAHPKRS